MELTELEKTLLVSFYALAKGSTEEYVDESLLLSKFPIRQRKLLKEYIRKFVKKGILIKHKKENSYRVSKKAIPIISSLIMKGVTFRF